MNAKQFTRGFKTGATVQRKSSQSDHLSTFYKITCCYTWYLNLNASLSLSVVKEYQQAVIIVPTLLLLGTLVTLLALLFLRYCPERKQRRTTTPQRYHSSSHRQTQGHSHTQRHSHRHNLQGIDGKFLRQFFILFSLWSRAHTDVSLSLCLSLSL